MADRIITIGRQCGSGGHTIGRLLAQRLGLAFYDKEIVELTAAKTKFSPEFIQSHGEYFHSGALGHIIGYGTRFDGSYKTGSSLTDQLHQAQSEVILEVAAQGPCVIVGRCADYILQDKADCLRVFIHADTKFRARRIVEEYGEREASPEQRLREKDKRRAAYHRFYTDMKWGHAQNYDLTLNSGTLGIDRCVDIIRGLY